MVDEAALSVAEAASACGIGVHALRFYERAGVLVAVPRNGRGRRVYGSREFRAVRFDLRLRATGMQASTSKRYADFVRAGAETEEDRLELLLERREAVQAALTAQQDHLAAIDAKIADYQRHRAAGAASGLDQANGRHGALPNAEGPVALIAGASSGIGLATAVAAARAGWRAFATVSDPARSEALRTAAGDA